MKMVRSGVALFGHELAEEVLVVEVQLVVDRVGNGVVGVSLGLHVPPVLELLQLSSLGTTVLQYLLLQHLTQLVLPLAVPPPLLTRLLLQQLFLPTQPLPVLTHCPLLLLSLAL